MRKSEFYELYDFDFSPNREDNYHYWALCVIVLIEQEAILRINKKKLY